MARADLAELATYIASENASAAYRVHDDIRRQTEMLAMQPEIGRPSRVRGTRDLVVTGTPYIAAYRVGVDVVTVLRVLHGARRWPQKI
jgi:toxin ParE1/3/4